MLADWSHMQTEMDADTQSQPSGGILVEELGTEMSKPEGSRTPQEDL